MTFSFDVAENCLFMPTRIQFLISRIGTDSGVADVNWQNSDGIISLALGLEPNRNKAENGWYTSFDEEINTIKATTGEQKMIINIYNINAGKEMAIGNVIISGVITSTASGIDEVENDAVIHTEYYNMQGMRILNPKNGVFIKKMTMGNNKQVTQKQRF